MAQRKVWLDYIKLIAMFLVVVYHTPPRCECDGYVHELALFNMGAPVFFFAAGYLFNITRQGGFLAFLLHRARQLLIPYASFSVIFYALWLVVGRKMAGGQEMDIDSWTPVWQFLQGAPDVVLGTFWFLVALFTMQLIYYPIRKYLPGYWPLGVAVLLNLSLFVIPDTPVMHLWNLDKALLYMPIYAIGNCCRPQVDKLVSMVQTGKCGIDVRVFHRCVAAAVLGLGFLILAPVHWDREPAYVLAPLAIILVLPLYTMICRGLEAVHSPAMDRIARTVAINGISYLALQNYLIGIIKMVIGKLAGPATFDDNIILKIVIALVVMAILYPLALIIERYLPFLLGKPYKKQ